MPKTRFSARSGRAGAGPNHRLNTRPTPGPVHKRMTCTVTADAGKYPAGNAQASPHRCGLNAMRGKSQTHASLDGLRQGRGTARKILSAAPSTSQIERNNTQGNYVGWRAFVSTRRWCDESCHIAVTLTCQHVSTACYRHYLHLYSDVYKHFCAKRRDYATDRKVSACLMRKHSSPNPYGQALTARDAKDARESQMQRSR